MRAGLGLSFVLALATSVTGCRDEGFVQLTSIRDEVCRCKTPRCGEDAMQKVAQVQVEGTPRSRRVAREMMDCLAELYATGAPETGPDVALPESPPAP